MKPGPKPKAKCKRGHIIAEVGRNKSRTCRKCRQEYDKERRDFIKKYFNENNL